MTQLQSGPPGTFNIAGLDTNGDGDAVNDRPLVGNPRAPLNTAGIDGVYLGATQGAYYDLDSVNSPEGTLVPVTPQQVHWLVPFGGAEITPLEIGRNSYTNPGSTVWNLAVEKDIPAPWTHLESARFEIRAEATDVGNHNDVGPLDTNILHIGSGRYLSESWEYAHRHRQEPSILGEIELLSRGRRLATSIALEHFHFYSELDRATKCGFSSTPAS